MSGLRSSDLDALVVERIDDSGTRPESDRRALGDRHPENAEELQAMFDGLDEFATYCQLRQAECSNEQQATDSKPAASNDGPGHRWRRASVLAAAALVLVSVGTFVFVKGDRLFGPAGSGVTSTVRTAPVAAARLMAAQAHAAVVEFYRVPLGAFQPPRQLEIARHLVAAERLLGRDDDAPDARGTRQRLAELRASFEQVPDLRAALSSASHEDSPTDSEVCMVFNDRFLRQVEARGAAPARELQTRTIVGPLAFSCLSMNLRRLKMVVYDRQRGGFSSTAQILAQQVGLDDGAVSDTVHDWGTAPFDEFVPVGDWRITIVDPNSSDRFSQARVLVIVDPTLPTPRSLSHMFFLPPSDQDYSDMIPHDGGHVGYGSRASNSLVFHRPEDGYPPEDVGPFLLDPMEVSYTDYEDFSREYGQILTSHADMFNQLGIDPLLLTLVPMDQLQGGPNDSRFRSSEFPIAGLPWYDAVRYANWLGKRLPTDREWECAAQGVVAERRVYPWGPHYPTIQDTRFVYRDVSIDQAIKDNSSYTVQFVLTGVDTLPMGQTPRAIHRMADNVSEWVEDLMNYSWTTPTGSEVPEIQQTLNHPHRVLRGSSFMFVSETSAQCDSRAGGVPNRVFETRGFRCAKLQHPPSR